MKLYQNLLKLKDYTPKDRMFTSQDEMKFIIDSLSLKEATNDDLQNYRDMTVMMWNQMLESCIEEDRVYKIMNALQSITSVIDDVKLYRELEV